MLSSIFLAWLFALQASAQHVEYHVPAVSKVVSAIKAEYSEYFHFDAVKQLENPTKIIEERATTSCAPYWLDSIKHQGIAPYNDNSTYQVYRNVKSYGAKGDGKTDDTAAINKAISDGGRCGPDGCQSSTRFPATVYFPPGTYIVSSSIIDYYFTNLVGHPTCPPTLKATSDFVGLGVIDGDQYQSFGQGWTSTNVFYRQVRNFVIDLTGVPAAGAVTGIHWPTAQATSLQNIQFLMSTASGTQHQGILIEDGSGGFLADLVFDGGLYGMNIGNQQFTIRNITIRNAVEAIHQNWDWTFTYSGLTISNCQVGLNMSNGHHGGQQVTTITIVDSSISNTKIGVITAHDQTSLNPASGGLILENVAISNVPTIIKQDTGRIVYAGTTGSTTIAAWGEGHYYAPTGPNYFERAIGANSRPSVLTTSSGKYYFRSKPQYSTLSTSNFLSVRSAGAKGDGTTDDTSALQAAINSAKAAGKVLFVDAGTYKITSTVKIPAGSKIVGESYPNIMATGSFFNNINSPKNAIQVGNAGDVGTIEWSDMVVSTSGPAAGAILIGYALASPAGQPSGMWDVHVRIGGFVGSSLQAGQCLITPKTKIPPAKPNSACISGFLGMHIGKSASGLYMENNWIWTADHDLDDATSSSITIYSGRGMLIDSTAGSIWLVGTAVEHFSLYQYQFVNTQNIYSGVMQTETPYYQPNPDARTPFPTYSAFEDPVFSASSTSNNADAWGLRLVNTTNVLIYGAGLYSFFTNYSNACAQGQLNGCQTQILSVEGKASNVNLYGLSTVGTSCQITRNGACIAKASDNVGNFVDSIALYRVK